MSNNVYRSTADMLARHPGIMAIAARYRVARLLQGEAAACDGLGALTMLAVNEWHRLQAAEGRAAKRQRQRQERENNVHRAALSAARRQEAAAFPVPTFRSA